MLSGGGGGGGSSGSSTALGGLAADGYGIIPDGASVVSVPGSMSSMRGGGGGGGGVGESARRLDMSAALDVDAGVSPFSGTSLDETSGM